MKPQEVKTCKIRLIKSKKKKSKGRYKLQKSTLQNIKLLYKAQEAVIRLFFNCI